MKRMSIFCFFCLASLAFAGERTARRDPGSSGPGQASYLSGSGKELAAPYRNGEMRSIRCCFSSTPKGRRHASCRSPSPSFKEGVLQKNFSQENYFIKKGYIARSSYTHFDDTQLKDEFQNEVYLAAYELAKEYELDRIADIGCGSGYKLLKYFSDKETTGFEIEPTLSALRRMYPFHHWSLSDFSRSLKGPAACYDMIICSDVIEHVVNPDDLLNWINNEFTFRYLVISTPDRDELIHVWKDPYYGPQTQSGPPVNSAHIREWSFSEFAKYISQYFEIVSHFHCKGEFYDQVIIAKKKVP